jgi:hypothetical protein
MYVYIYIYNALIQKYETLLSRKEKEAEHRRQLVLPVILNLLLFSSLMLNLVLRDTQSLCASETSPPRSRCTFV